MGELKSTKIKSMNDFVSGLILSGVSLYLIFGKNIVQGKVTTGPGGPLVRADMYIRMLGILMLLLSAIMVIRSVNFRKAVETKGFSFTITRESIFTAFALAGFIIFLKPLGFGITTFLFSFFVVCLYSIKENQGKGFGRREKIKKALFAALFSLILVAVVYLVFAKILLVTLP